MNSQPSLFFILYRWLVYIPFLAVSTFIFGSTAFIIGSLISKPLGSYIGGSWWARINAFMAGMYITVSGKENISPGTSYVVVSNHMSLFDIFVLYGQLGIDFRWVMKQELRKVPFLGAGCAAIGHVFIDRSNREMALASINKARDEIKDGTSVLFFPEGTRSDDGVMLPFKKGAFRFALDMNLPILPVTISGTNECLPNNTLKLSPGHATLTIHKAIDISSYDEETIDRLMSDTREMILNKTD